MQFLGRLLEEVAAEELGLKKWEESQGGSHGYSVRGGPACQPFCIVF